MMENPSARCSTRNAEPARRTIRLLYVERVLELLARAEAGLLGRLDGDLFAGLGIAPLAAGARRDHESAEAGQPHLVTRLQGRRDEVEYAIHGLGRGVLVQAGLLG